MNQFASRSDLNTLVLAQPAVDVEVVSLDVDVEVVSLNIDDLDVEELEHRLELAGPGKLTPCVILAEWAL